jgi:glutamine synthetase type III
MAKQRKSQARVTEIAFTGIGYEVRAAGYSAHVMAGGVPAPVLADMLRALAEQIAASPETVEQAGSESEAMLAPFAEPAVRPSRPQLFLLPSVGEAER